MNDILIQGGRVIDPASGRDEIADVAIAKGKIARIAHCGYYGAFDIVVALTALEMALRDLGHDAEPGSGVAGAQRIFAEAGLAPEPVS